VTSRCGEPRLRRQDVLAKHTTETIATPNNRPSNALGPMAGETESSVAARDIDSEHVDAGPVAVVWPVR
jgi:hypothetical protein